MRPLHLGWLGDVSNGFMVRPKTGKCGCWVKLVPLSAGHAKVEFVEVLPIRVAHVAQAALKPKAERFMKADRTFVKGVNEGGTFLIAKFTEIVAQKEGDGFPAIVLAPVTMLDRKRIFESAIPPHTIKAIDIANSLTILFSIKQNRKSSLPTSLANA